MNGAVAATCDERSVVVVLLFLLVVAAAAAAAVFFVVTVLPSRKNMLHMWICGTEMLIVPDLSSLQLGIPS